MTSLAPLMSIAPCSSGSAAVEQHWNPELAPNLPCHVQGSDTPLQRRVGRRVVWLSGHLLWIAEPQWTLTPCMALCSISEMQ